LRGKPFATVKASNFGHHGKSAHYLTRSVAPSRWIWYKKWNKSKLTGLNCSSLSFPLFFVSTKHRL
jgi:hypothetical protein